MSTAYWDQVRSAEMAVPTDRPLPDLTAELTTMLGSTDPVVRDEIAYPILATWVCRRCLRRPPRRAGRRDGGGPGPWSRRVGHRLGVPAQLLRAGAGRVHRAGQRRVAAAARARSWSGATGSAAGWCASATCAASCPAGAGRTRSPTAPTRWGCSRTRPHLGLNELTVVLDVLADRVIEPTPAPLEQRRARPAGPRHDGGAASPAGAAADHRAVARPDRRRRHRPHPGRYATPTCAPATRRPSCAPSTSRWRSRPSRSTYARTCC